MKLIKSSSGYRVQISAEEWRAIGESHGWIVKKAQKAPVDTQGNDPVADEAAAQDQATGQEGGTFGPGPTGIQNVAPQPQVQQAINPAVAPALGQQPVAPVNNVAKPTTAPAVPQPSANAPRFHSSPNQVIPQGGKKKEMVQPIKR